MAAENPFECGIPLRYRVAIVEDEQAAAQQLAEYLKWYSERGGVSFKVDTFTNAETFMLGYKPDFDVVFMDIELPGMSGMDAAKKLREADRLVSIVFVTNMQQFAAKGYSVGASDFLIKPVTYYALSTMLDRVLPSLAGNKDKEITIKTSNGMRRVFVNSIAYIEVRSHKLIYHTESDTIDGWGSLNELESRAEFGGFARGNNCYLINLRYVTEVDGTDVKVLGDTLQLSRQKRKAFVRRLNEYLGDR